MPRPTTVARTVGAAALTAAALGVATPAHAASAFRYWGYFQETGSTWQFATKGPDQVVPADGSVEGWRYAVGDASTTHAPRATPTFDAVCGSTATAAGKKRVAVVVDFGRTADAREGVTDVPQPFAKCASVDVKATGAQVLAAVSTARVENKMVCGIDGYPATGCSDTLAAVPAAAKASDTPVAVATPGASPSASAAPSAPAGKTDAGSGTSAGTWVGVGAVAVVLAALAGLLASRRKRA